MSTRTGVILLSAVALFALPLSAQSDYAQIDGSNCSTLWGYAWDSGQPNTPISIDLYDGGTPLATVLANLPYAGIGNGYHGFSYTIPPSLKDGTTHTIVHYITGTHINISGSSGTISCPAGTTGYVQYDTDPLTSINTSNWYPNGIVSGTSGGLTATSSSGGSLISKVAVPGATPTNYEVMSTLTLTASGGTYVSYLRATIDAETGPSPAGTFYSVEITPTFSGSSCTATIAVNKRFSGSITTLATSSSVCHNGTVVRAVINGWTIIVWVDGYSYIGLVDTSITTGSPGVGALNTPSGNSIASVALGPGDSTAPSAPVAATIQTSLLPTRMDVRFEGVPDDPGGTGIAYYQLYRDGSYMESSSQPVFTDETLTASSTHSYSVVAVDFAWNTASTSFSITTPPTGSVDDRRVGVRPTGAYWGASPEQIDLLSGNLNFTIPLLSAQMRGGGAVPISLSYNAQNWRKDTADWNFGTDVGYGYGWRLSAGSLTPFITYPGSVDHYTFVDATGAEYRLDQYSSGIWSSKESLYVWYDWSANILHFRDGSYWTMGCTSSGTEPDTGTMYPTTIENSNGNQILLRYNAGNQLTYVNSSARIQSVEDVRAVSLGGVRQTYTFVYNVDPTPHLTSVQNTIGTSEAYQFTFGSMTTLYDPFTGSGYTYANALVPLQSMTAEGIGMQHSFTYNSSGEMTQVIFPYGGYFKYTYGNVTYSSGFTQPEVSTRIMSKDGTTGSEDTYALTHESSPSSYPVHQFTQIAVTSTSGVGKKKWSFSTSGSNIGLATQYQGIDPSGSPVFVQNDFTWTQDSAGNFYIGSTINTFNPGGAQSKVSQTVDTHGNVTQVQKYQFGSLTTPARTYNYTYLNSSSYTNLYIYNRLTSATVTDGTTTTGLVSNGYDSNYRSVTNPSSTPYEWDAGYSSAAYRGNVTSSGTLSGSASYAYDNAGNIGYATVNGVESTVATSTTTNFAAPDQLSVGSLSSSMTWNSFLGLTNDSGPNGDSISTSYDSYARPTQTTSPFGATTYYGYNSPPFSSSSPATVTIYPNGTSGRWTRNTLDGFGRTTKTETGDSSSTKSSSEMVYAPCACTPLGKLTQQSMPHAPGASSPTWTTYTYDGIGRTVYAATVGSDTQGTTSYEYVYSSTQALIYFWDPAGNFKIYVMDVFNNLVEVAESATPSEPSGAGSYYTYDLLDHLVNVWMPRTAGSQTRSFVYSGNNLTSATNPENGTVNYTYNSYNKVATKTDAKGQAIVYTYDSLARLTKIQRYPTGTSNPEDVCQQGNYYYDSPYDSTYTTSYLNGRLTAVQYYGGSAAYGNYGTSGGPTSCDTKFTELYMYNQAGARTGKRLQVTRSVEWFSHPYVLSPPTFGDTSANLDSTYTYDTEGRMTAEQYPNPTSATGPDLGWAFDTMGRPYTMADLGTSSPIITGTSYNEANQLTNMTGNVNETRVYNSMLQLKRMYNGAIDISYNYPSSNNNGKIQSQTDNVSGEQVQYTYDAINRLASATATSNAWGQGYSYDGFGNLTAQTVTVGSAPPYSATPDPATNRVGGADANGNIGAGTYCGANVYDVENRLTTLYCNYSSGWQYSYAPGNKRVWRGIWSSPGTLTTDELTYWSVNGKKLGTYSITVVTGYASTAPSLTLTQTGTNYYFGGKLIKNASGYVGADRLGSIGHYYPFGWEKGTGNPASGEKFTGYFRDAETGLDYAVNRYHIPGTGSFLTPDPFRERHGGGSDPKDPTTWNRYSHTHGDPITRTDPTGLDDDDEVAECALDCESAEEEEDQNEGGGVNYSSSQIVGYDSEGNPIIGDPNEPTIVNVNANGQTVTVTFNSSSCPTGQVLTGNGSCDIPIYGWNGNGQQILIGVAAIAGPVANGCFIAGWFVASALPGLGAAFAEPILNWAAGKYFPYKWVINPNTAQGIAQGFAAGKIGLIGAASKSGPALTASAQGVAAVCAAAR